MFNDFKEIHYLKWQFPKAQFQKPKCQSLCCKCDIVELLAPSIYLFKINEIIKNVYQCTDLNVPNRQCRPTLRIAIAATTFSCCVMLEAAKHASSHIEFEFRLLCGNSGDF